MKVQNVLSKQGTDLAPLINATAGQDALALTALLRAESGLDEKAWRYTRWPDCSSGLSQVIAANLGFGTYQTPATDEELVLYRAYMEQPANAIREGWRFFRPALVRMGGDPVLAMVAYNVGPVGAPTPERLRDLITAGLAGSVDPTAKKAAHAWKHYGQHWQAAQTYAIPEEEPMPPTEPSAPPTLEEEIAQLKRQQALQTLALRRILENDLEGANGAAGAVVALEGGQTNVEVRLGK